MRNNILKRVAEQGPLIHTITNSITSNDCANIILACGAYPTMAESEEEAAEISAAADALVLNLGNPTPARVRAMLLAGKAANQKGIPVILDPVGIGASQFRTQAVQAILEAVRVSVIRGNASEIRALSGCGGSRGVDAAKGDAITLDTLSYWIDVAKRLANHLNAVVLMSGQMDVIVEATTACAVRNGHPMMSKVTGTGCMLSALTGAYCAGNHQAVFDAAVAASGVMGLCGEQAYRRVQLENTGTASFRIALIDAVSRMNQTTLEEGIRVDYQ